jgi:hypothetical protein
MLRRLAEGTHRFNEAPAEHRLGDDHVRVIVVGDWGSGLSTPALLQSL